jgi:DNA-binding beta-propeller fold protein YncE
VIDLTVIQPVIVGNSPFGVSVDTDRDLAIVTNSSDGTVSLVDLVSGLSIVPVNADSVVTGSGPQGVATIPRLGLAVTANNGSNDFTVVDVTGTNNAKTVALCPGCAGATGVAINQDDETAAVTSSITSQVSFINLLDDTIGLSPIVDADPGALAIDPNPTSTTTSPLVAVATSSQASSVDLVAQNSGGISARINGFQNPSGVVFDPVNQVFLVANSLQNTVVIIDPNTFIPSSVRVGINPTSIDYNFQASTLVTANHISDSMTVLEYVCPPPANGGVSPCTVPHAREILGLGSSPQFSVAIDPKMNLAVLVDQAGNRVLLVPLPH